MATRFDYNTFYAYYTDLRNVTSTTPIPTKFYHRYPGKNAILNHGMTGDTFITIHGKKYYIKADPSTQDIHFTLPTTIPGETGLWDFHYHFGMGHMSECRNKSVLRHSQRNVPKDVIYFHKTTQDPIITKYKKQKNCYFSINEFIHDVNKISDIDCLETTTSKMTKNFPLGSEDLAVITELIRRPFYGKQYGGRRKTKKVYQKGARKTKRRRALIHSM